MSLQRNYYEVLGIPPGATTDQIKKKYRELARKFHPDVVQDKVLGQRVFSQINQAYRVLGDPERRAEYNTTLTPANTVVQTQVRPPAPASTPTRPAPAPPVRNAAAARPNPPPTSAAARPSPAATRPAAAVQPTAVSSGMAQKAHAVAGLLANADNAVMASKPIEARAFCAKVLEIDPHNARAMEMLGDALVQMGQREDAAVQYRNALKETSSSLVQSKLNRLEQSAASTRTNPPHDENEKPSGGLFGRLLGRK